MTSWSAQENQSKDWYLLFADFITVLDVPQLEVKTTVQASSQHQQSWISLVDPTVYLFSMQNSGILSEKTHITNSKPTSWN